MDTIWYIVKVMPGKERSLTEDFNKQILQEKIKNIIRFVCPTEKEFVIVKNKKVLREKVLYSGYLYFETPTKLGESDLKTIAHLPNIMGMMGDKTPVLLRDSDIRRILKDDSLDNHIESKRTKYSSGDKVMVSDGPFNGFEGIISEINGEKVSVEVRIFGRNTPVELTLTQIEKV
jgi:transcriptional antiterminator NusG